MRSTYGVGLTRGRTGENTVDSRPYSKGGKKEGLDIYSTYTVPDLGTTDYVT